MDILYISELKAEANLGVYAWEKRMPQTVELNIEFAIPNSKASETDNIADTIDYAVVVDRIRSELSANRFELLEAMAEFIANLLLHEFGSPWAKVNIAKIGMIRQVKKIGITIERRRG
jgi:7,8-dihydroneopterin aldolase/epimerase/oxygenase